MTSRHFMKFGTREWIRIQQKRKPLVDAIQLSSYSNRTSGRHPPNHTTSLQFSTVSIFSSYRITPSSSSGIISRNFWSFRSKNTKPDNISHNDYTLETTALVPTTTVSDEAVDDMNNTHTLPSTVDDGMLTPDQAMANFEKLATSLTHQNINPVDSVALIMDSATTTAASASSSSSSSASSFVATWYYPQDHALQFIEYIHTISGLNYAYTIALVTVTFRALLFPLFVQAQRNTSRMAHMKPEMDILRQRIDKLDPADREGQLRFSMEMRKLFDKYQCNPFKALLVPLLQAPIFMSMFFALQKMPLYYEEELSTSGILWFTNLAAPDPYHILPVLSAVSFLAIMELGKEQMMASSVNNPAQGRMMINFLRAVAVIMIPVTLDFSTAIFCYWTTNNTISLIQTGLFRNANVRKGLGIWELPKVIKVPSSADTNKGFVESIQDAIRNSNKKGDVQNIKDQIKAHNQAIENKKKAELLRKEKKVIS